MQKSGEEKRKKIYIAIVVQCVVSYTARSSMTAGNAGLDVALRVSL